MASLLRGQRAGVLVLALSLVLTALPARAQDFVPLADVASKRPAGRVLFFPLAERFGEASPYALLPAAGRRVVWTPDSAELPVASLPVAPLRAVGTPPARPEDARYLVPVLDAGGAGLRFVAMRYDGGRLAPFAGTPAPGLDVVPLLAGPRLDATPSEAPLTRVLEAPVEVDASALAGVQPSVLVRKATPSRVVFGVQVGERYLALVDEAGLAVAATQAGRAGLAVAAPDDFDPTASTTTTAAPALAGEEEDDDGFPWAALLLPAGLVALAVLGTVFRRTRARNA